MPATKFEKGKVTEKVDPKVLGFLVLRLDIKYLVLMIWIMKNIIMN